MAESVYLSRKIYFSSGHRYHNPAWSDEKNRAIFGACNNPHGHGHNYELEVTVFGPVDEDSGMVINLTDLDQILKEKIMGPLDHRFLDKEVDFFKTNIPTTENLALFCFQELSPCFNKPLILYKVKVCETSDLFSEYYGDNPPRL